MSGFAVTIDGMQVSRVDGPEDQAIANALHYAVLYVQDGAPNVEIVEIGARKPRRWKVSISDHDPEVPA